MPPPAVPPMTPGPGTETVHQFSPGHYTAPIEGAQIDRAASMDPAMLSQTQAAAKVPGIDRFLSQEGPPSSTHLVPQHVPIIKAVVPRSDSHMSNASNVTTDPLSQTHAACTTIASAAPRRDHSNLSSVIEVGVETVHSLKPSAAMQQPLSATESVASRTQDSRQGSRSVSFAKEITQIGHQPEQTQVVKHVQRMVPDGNKVTPDWKPLVTTAPKESLSTQQAAAPGALGLQATQIVNHSHNQDHLYVKPQSLVQIPVFNDGTPQSLAPPVNTQQVKAHKYQSSACHLAQHSYGDNPVYAPSQTVVHRQEWHDDPFYGWRNGTSAPNSDRPPEPARPQTLSNLTRYGHDGANDGIRKCDDPFAGWLPDRRAPPEPALRDNPFHAWAQQRQSPPHGANDQERFANARLASLPSFSASPLSRFDKSAYDYEPQEDTCSKTQAAVKLHQKYDNHAHPQQKTQMDPADQWKHDAFYGWLPQRGGHQGENQPNTYHPLDIARNARLPSFSEAGLASRAASRQDSRCPSLPTTHEDTSGSTRCGVLTVRVVAAYNLVNMDTGVFGDVSDPYVKVALGEVEKRTHTINNDLNPKWNSHPFLFDVVSKNQVLRLSVWDEDTLSADDPLGKMEIPLEGIIAKAGQPIAVRDSLWDVASGELEVELSFCHG